VDISLKDSSGIELIKLEAVPPSVLVLSMRRIATPNARRRAGLYHEAGDDEKVIDAIRRVWRVNFISNTVAEEYWPRSRRQDPRKNPD
jgi:hypothetical protein